MTRLKAVIIGHFNSSFNASNHNFSGRWIGFSSSGVVKEGLWEWERPRGTSQTEKA
jgi:hypothetical protein